MAACVQEFIRDYNPDQIILHPRVTEETSRQHLIVLRPTTIPGDIHCELAKGGVLHLRDMETREIYESFNLSEVNLDQIYPQFVPIVKAFAIIAPFADQLSQNLTDQSTAYRTPVYEIKCFQVNGVTYMNLFDYEIL